MLDRTSIWLHNTGIATTEQDMIRVQITMQVVNEDGDVLNTRGFPGHLNKDGRIEATRALSKNFETVGQAHNALNLAWGFVGPIDTAISRNG